MRNEALGAIMAAVIAIAFVAGFAAGTFLKNNTVTIFTTQTTSTVTTNPNSTTCIILAEGNLILTILNSSSGKPISSVPVTIAHLAPYCPPNPHTTSSLGTMNTNGSGIITCCSDVGEYYLKVNYLGGYSINASVGPVKATCITLRIPSGELSISYSASFQTSCSG